MRTCRVCGERKDDAAFVRSSNRTISGFTTSGRCKDCRNKDAYRCTKERWIVDDAQRLRHLEKTSRWRFIRRSRSLIELARRYDLASIAILRDMNGKTPYWRMIIRYGAPPHVFPKNALLIMRVRYGVLETHPSCPKDWEWTAEAFEKDHLRNEHHQH